MKNYQDEKIELKQSKFIMLNFNLKIEIFKFLPLEQQLRMLLLNKKFSRALKSYQIFKTLKNFFTTFLNNFDIAYAFDTKKLKEIHFPELTEKEFFKICVYLLKFQLKDRESFKFYNSDENEEILNYEKKNYKILFEAMLDNNTIKSLVLNINNQEMSLKDLNYFSNFLMNYKNPTLKKLKIIGYSGHDINYTKELFKALEKNNSIKDLDLSQNFLGKNSQNLINLCNYLIYNKNLLILDLTENWLNDNNENIHLISEAIGTNDCLQYLNLKMNYIGNVRNNVFKLSEGIKKNKSIKILNLEVNNLAKNLISMQYLSEALIENDSLETLYLGCNDIGYETAGIKFFSEALQKNKKLKKLDLKESYIKNNLTKMEYFVNALKINSSIEELDLSYDYSDRNNIETYESFFEMLKNNKYIKIINFSCTFLGRSKKNIENLCNALKENDTLENLILSQIDLREKDYLINSIIEILKTNKSLKIIDISYNDLNIINFDKMYNKDKSLDFIESLRNNKKIVNIDLTGNFRNEDHLLVKEFLKDERIKV